MIIEILLGVVIVLLIVNIWLTYKKSGSDISKPLTDIRNGIQLMDSSLEKIDKSIRDDFQRNREEFNKIAKENREELSTSLGKFSDGFASSVTDLFQSFYA